jgi:DNA-binding transcriptional LysR family regulator
MVSEIDRSPDHTRQRSNMIMQRLFAAPLSALIVVAGLVALTAISPAAARDAAASEAEVRADDRAAVASCLDLVAQASKRYFEALNKVQAEDDGEPKAEKIDPAEWLRHEAVVAGQGVGIFSDVLVAAELASGALVRAFDLSLPGYRFYVVSKPSHPRERIIRAFSAWLLSVR